jgi:N-acetylglutamate synthase/N-acetylornithine aminotransferase
MVSGPSLAVSGATGWQCQRYSGLAREFEVRLSHPTQKTLRCSLGVTGRPFTIDKVKLEDLENGVLTASWRLEASHSSVSGDKVEEMLKTVLIGTLVSSAKGAWDVSDEFNGLLPGFNFTQIEDFLAEVWEGKS